jgi:hypothetical protein
MVMLATSHLKSAWSPFLKCCCGPVKMFRGTMRCRLRASVCNRGVTNAYADGGMGRTRIRTKILVMTADAVHEGRTPVGEDATVMDRPAFVAPIAGWRRQIENSGA